MHFSRRDIFASAFLLPTMARAQAPANAFRTLEAREGSLRLLAEPAAPTPIWGFDGTVPGPVLRVKKGEEVRVKLVNKLAQPTAIHWHGVRIINAMDGVAGLTQAPVAPGGSFDYRFTPPDSGTFLYRASAYPHVAEQKGRGLYGVLIVEEEAPPTVDHEVMLVLDDWRLDAKGAIEADFLKPDDVKGEGRIGATLTANSKQPPETMTFAPGARVRLRLVNACNARMAGIIFDDVSPMIIAIDGQPCDAFAPIRNTLPIGPGARFEVMFDMPSEAGKEARIVSRGGGLKSDPGGEENRVLLTLRSEGAALSARPAIASLPRNPRLPPEIKLQNAKRLDLTIEASEAKDPRQTWLINGVAGSPQAKPLFIVPRNQVISFGFFNHTQVVQTLHLHGHHMRILHLLDDGWEPYWRDAVIIPPTRTVRIAFIADNPGKWLIESAILEHAMSGVSAWFEVRG